VGSIVYIVMTRTSS